MAIASIGITTTETAARMMPGMLRSELCVRGFLERVLLSNGYPVIEAACAEQAVEQFGEFNRDISLLIAEVMPPCSGIRVSLQLRALIPSLKIVLTSGSPANW